MKLETPSMNTSFPCLLRLHFLLYVHLNLVWKSTMEKILLHDNLIVSGKGIKLGYWSTKAKNYCLLSLSDVSLDWRPELLLSKPIPLDVESDLFPLRPRDTYQTKGNNIGMLHHDVILITRSETTRSLRRKRLNPSLGIDL